MKKTTAKFKPHIVAISNKGHISYHFVQSRKEESGLIGKIIGIYPTEAYLKSEKYIQEVNKKKLKVGD